MSTDLEVFEPRPPVHAHPIVPAAATAPAVADTDSWTLVVSDVIKLANVICETEFVPRRYRDNAPATAAAILAGRELGLPPMTALRHVQVVEGSPSLSAEYKRARVLAAGHDFDILDLSITRCRVSGRRRGSRKPPLEITFTMEDARRAGLVKAKGAWETRPRRMLFARAGTEVCDFLFADVTNGLPTTELLAEGGGDDGFDGYRESPAQAPPAPALPAPAQQRTARRKAVQSSAPQQERNGAAETEAPRTPAATAGTEAQRTSAAPDPGPGLPPLPGEDEPPAGPPFDPDQPGTATKGEGGQLTALWASLNQAFGFSTDEKAQARVVVEHIIGRQLDGDSTANLSWNEAKTALDTLANWAKIAESRGEEPRDVLIAAMTAADTS
ncbi:MAG TPA: hypothetical protein VLW50_19735 [Streptosporangiaceae bacterium]|nr:hypothetical protein [Streptosporangiaceae bacterium]